MSPLRTLIVDDSSLFRRTLNRILSTISDIDIVGTACDGDQALAKATELNPDLVTLDVEMPGMNGLETLQRLKKILPNVFVIMVSSQTQNGAGITLKCLEHGAFDFIAKPESNDAQENERHLSRQIASIVQAVSQKYRISKLLYGDGGAKQKLTKSITKPTPKSTVREIHTQGPIQIIGIAVSTGGPNALGVLIPKLRQDNDVPIVIVQHMPPVFTKSLAESLNKNSHLTVVEAVQGEKLKSNHVYIAPGGKQMKINMNREIVITDDPPENHCKPAADYLFRSLASVFKQHSLGVIMTGMGSDGVIGLQLMKQYGVTIIAQDEPSSVVHGMPGAAIEAGIVDQILPLSNLSSKITELVAKYKRHALNI